MPKNKSFQEDQIDRITKMTPSAQKAKEKNEGTKGFLEDKKYQRYAAAEAILQAKKPLSYDARYGKNDMTKAGRARYKKEVQLGDEMGKSREADFKAARKAGAKSGDALKAASAKTDKFEANTRKALQSKANKDFQSLEMASNYLTDKTRIKPAQQQAKESAAAAKKYLPSSKTTSSSRPQKLTTGRKR